MLILNSQNTTDNCISLTELTNHNERDNLNPYTSGSSYEKLPLLEYKSSPYIPLWQTNINNKCKHGKASLGIIVYNFDLHSGHLFIDRFDYVFLFHSICQNMTEDISFTNLSQYVLHPISKYISLKWGVQNYVKTLLFCVRIWWKQDY